MSISKGKLAVAGVVLTAVLVVALYIAGAWMGLYGRHVGAGTPSAIRVPAALVADRAATARAAAHAVGVAQPKQVLFGDLHAHTTFSADAFYLALPMMQGAGAHPVADACDYARFCSALDFWSINDHAEASTPRHWRETKTAIRECAAVAGSDAQNPDVAVFLGWEWSQIGRTVADHYGHKNVIFKGLRDDEVPTRPIASAGESTLRAGLGGMSPAFALIDFPNRQPYYDYMELMHEMRDVPYCPAGVDSRALPEDCYEYATTPRALYDKLDQWGFDTIVIPHGNAFGLYTPAGTTWDKDLAPAMNDPDKQRLIEVASCNGNSEEYRDWRDVTFDAQGTAHCPEPTADHLPSCWRAGEIVQERCRAAGFDAAECGARAAKARENYVKFGLLGHLTVPGATVTDWLDAGQCKDCFEPAFNYRPGGSAQYALAISNFDDPRHPRRFRFGFIASSDDHHARPGNGYKELDRLHNVGGSHPRDAGWLHRLGGSPEAPAARSIELDLNNLPRGSYVYEIERAGSFFLTSGLVAVHANGRGRDQVWDALKRKEVYGTSGDRILLWFDLVNAPAADGATVSLPMGSEVGMTDTPRFAVRAVGAFKQKPGCPTYSTNSLTPERLRHLCNGECYNPSDERKRITRIEVVRIRPQVVPDEPVGTLIEDPWRTLPCAPRETGCAVQFEDPEFLAAARPAVYYVRAIEEPSPAINGGNLRCNYDASGRCIAVHPCYNDYRTDVSDECLTTVEERAWSSPIYIDPLESGNAAGR
ncbi:MAG: DUF3604 domain-containing protein [Candidatus Binatia bacterium]